MGSFDSLEFCPCGWISRSLRDFTTYGKLWFRTDRKYHGNGGIVSSRRVVRCAVTIPCITAFWWRSGDFIPVDELYEHKYAKIGNCGGCSRIGGILITAVKTGVGWTVSDLFLFCFPVGRVFIGKRLQQCDHLFQ